MSEMNSFQDAFYIIAKELGFDYAQPLSPREVFEQQILPRIRELIAAQPTTSKPTQPLGWSVRKLHNSDGSLRDCIVSSPRPAGSEMAFDCEVMGDDYEGFGGVEEKLRHAEMIVAWANGIDAPPVSAHGYQPAAQDPEHEHIGYMNPSALFGLLAGREITTTISSAIPSLIQPAPTPPENWAVPIYVVRRQGEEQ